MSISNHLESQFEKQQSQAQANPELNLVSLSGSGTGAEGQQAHLSPESQVSPSTAHAFLPKFEIGESTAPANSEKQTATDSTPPPKPGGASGRPGKGGKRTTGAPDWTSGQFYQSAGQTGASADSSGDTSQPTISTSADGGEGSWQARNAAPKEGFTASALSAAPEGQQGADGAEHTWSDEKAAHHAAASASTDDYHAQQQQQGDSDSPAWHNFDSMAQHDSSFDSASPVASDESGDSSTTNAPIDTFTNTSPVADSTSDEPAPIETSNANAGPIASASAGGNGTGSGSSGASQQASSASAPAASNDGGAGIGVANAAGVSQQAANLMTSFPTVALTNSSTQPSTNSANTTTGTGVSVPTNLASTDNSTPASGSSPGATLLSPSSESALGPNGGAVGSTASVFGPSAMPAEAAPTGAQYYVSPDGSATGTGSQADPFATLQQAADAMATSSIKTTDVESGTYDQSTALTLTSADSGETFIGNGSATLNGEGTAGNLITVNGANNVSVEGLNLTNTANNPVWTASDWFGAGTGEDAILAQNTSGDNFSYNNISNAGMAINFQGVTDSQVDGNNISNVQQALVVTQGDSGSSGNTIASNSIDNVSNVTGILDDNQGAINLVGDSNDTLYNNVVQNTAAAGISITTISSGDTVNQNTVQDTNTGATPSSSYDASATNPSDMGAIYAWSGAGNTTNEQLTISDNYVQNAGQGIENNGIYLDDGVSGATVTGNIVQGAGQGSASFDVLVHGGSDNTIADNILNLDSASGVEKGVFVQSDGYAMTGNSLTDNTFYASGANGGAIDTLVDSSSDNPAMSGNDYYGVPVPSIDSGAASNNPGYVSPDTGNYSLAANAAGPIIADTTPPTAPSVGDNTPPATPTDNNPPTTPTDNTPPATPIDNTQPATATATPVTPDLSTTPDTTTVTSSTLSNLYAADMAATDAISAQPTSEATMNVGATGDPALPANPVNLSPLTINGDSGLSALEQYGTLTQDADGSYTFNGNGQQVAPLDLNDVDNLTITNAVFADAGSTTGGLTISGDSNNVVVSNSTFSGDQYGINVDQSNNVEPTNIGIINNSFSNMDGSMPDGSPIQFLGAGAASIPAAANGENLIANNTINGTEQAIGSENGLDLLSIYNYANGANDADTLVYGNSVSGSLQLDGGGQTTGAGIIAELDPGTTGTPTVTVANNFITGQTGSGLGNGGSDADFIGNLITDSTGDVGTGSESGYNATGEFAYNKTDNSPVVPVAQNLGGWPVVYAPDGPPNDPGNTNSWDAGGGGDSTVAASPAAPSVSDNTPPATPAAASSNTPAATPTDSTPVAPILSAPSGPDTMSYSAASDLAAAESISSMPASPASMTDVGATTTPAALANPQDLAAVTVNGNDDITSALAGLGTLTENNGTYTLEANGNQLPPLVLNNVSNLNITNANFADVSGSGAVTINGDSSNVSVTNSNFSNISSGVDIYAVNGVMPSGITVDGNSFSDITGPWPSASAVQFAGSGAGEVAADPNAINRVSHNTVIDGMSLASPNSTDANLSGQDILSDYNNPYSVPTVFSSNLVDGSYTPADGSHPPDTAINAELSNDEWIAGNLLENQSNAGFGEDGSTNVTVTGNYAENVSSAYNYGPENGINPSGNWTYNNANTSPQAGNGWPELYAPDGLPDAPGNSNNWNT